MLELIFKSFKILKIPQLTIFYLFTTNAKAPKRYFYNILVGRKGEAQEKYKNKLYCKK